MEVDFGGIVKEYAVDRAAMLAREITNDPVLINFGGDLFSYGSGEKAWQVGVEDKDLNQKVFSQLSFRSGGLATSGTTRRFVEKNGKRFGHIVDPVNKDYVLEAPLSVTVLADTCLEAGFLSTLAMLQGSKAEGFLKENAAKYWLQR